MSSYSSRDLQSNTHSRSWDWNAYLINDISAKSSSKKRAKTSDTLLRLYQKVLQDNSEETKRSKKTSKKRRFHVEHTQDDLSHFNDEIISKVAHFNFFLREVYKESKSRKKEIRCRRARTQQNHQKHTRQSRMFVRVKSVILRLFVIIISKRLLIDRCRVIVESKLRQLFWLNSIHRNSISMSQIESRFHWLSWDLDERVANLETSLIRLDQIF